MASKIATLTFDRQHCYRVLDWLGNSALAVTSNHYVIDFYCDVTISRKAWAHCCVDLLESCNAEKSL